MYAKGYQFEIISDIGGGATKAKKMIKELIEYDTCEES